MIQNNTIKNNDIAVALYARVSSQQQLKDGTIQSQVDAIRRRIADDGMRIEESACYIDDGYGGSTLVRPAVPAIVDAELFEAVAEQMKENRKRLRSRIPGPRDLLTGLTVCKKCSYSLCAVGGGPAENKQPGYRYYRCIGRDSHRHGGPDCVRRAGGALRPARGGGVEGRVRSVERPGARRR